MAGLDSKCENEWALKKKQHILCYSSYSIFFSVSY